MKVRNANLKLSILSVAMVGVFSSMYTYADEEEAAALMNPTSSVTVEEIYVSQGSQKFGEYNGLNKQGGYINGNLNIRGGDGYKNNAEGNTTRWSVQGTDLGLSDRSASVGYSDQGNWGAKVGFDQLQHNLAPGYQTPYQGQMGGNGWTLPSNFGTSANTWNLTNAQKNAIAPLDISSTRQNTSVSAEKILENGFSTTFEFNHLDQSGAKPMAFASASINGADNRYISILPNPTNYQTDTLNLGLNWNGEKSRLTGSYFGSFFRDAYNQVNWTTFSGTNSTQTMSTMPSNQLQQLNLAGGHDFSSKTKLTGSLSYGRNTQNSSSGYDAQMIVPGTTVTPFNGLVNTAHADIKITDQSIKNLNLSAGYKYDSRDNLSQSNMQGFNSIEMVHPAYYPNTPLSFKKSVFELAGDYRVTTDQKVRLAYTNTYLNRYCNQYATGSSSNISPAPTGVVANNYPAGADCVTANYSRSNNINALYKFRVSEKVDAKFAYGVDIRQTSWNQNALTSMYSKNANSSLPSPLTVNMLPGQNGGDFLGFRPFFEASRNQQLVKGSINWQAAENMAFNLGGKYTYDEYPDSTYGITNANVWSVNADANFSYAENASVVAYVVQQNGMRNLNSKYNAGSTSVYGATGTAANVGTWSNTLTEKDTTLGLGIRHAGLMSGKLDLTGDATYSLGQSIYNTNVNNPASTYNCSSNTIGTCGSPGTISNRMASIKFGASYKIDKSSKIGLRYIYQHLASTDFYYNTLSPGSTPQSLMPTNQNSGSYNVNVIAASYTYSFD